MCFTRFTPTHASQPATTPESRDPTDSMASEGHDASDGHRHQGGGDIGSEGGADGLDAGAPVSAPTAADVALRFAPLLYQDSGAGGPDGLGAKADVPTTVDYDGDLDHTNNWDHLVSYELEPAVYYALTATQTHWFLTYTLYHPRDWELLCTGLFTECHEGDLESAWLVVRRTGGEGLGEGGLFEADDATSYQGARGPPFQHPGPLGQHLRGDQFLNEGGDATAPWARTWPESARGDALLDPAWAWSRLLGFPEPFALESYEVHPLLPGVAASR